MDKRYQRNKNTISETEQNELKQKKVTVIGCGGLGGYIAEMLCRIGIGSITLVDDDIIDESNLNRQLISHSDNIGKKKAFELKARLQQINPNLNVIAIDDRFSEKNAEYILQNTEIVLDALDTIPVRKLLQQACKQLNIIMIHGAIAGMYGQVSVIYPGDNVLNQIYPDTDLQALEKDLGNPSFTPACIASIQVAECIKILLHKGDILRKKLLMLNLLNMEFDIIDLA
ncbi:MAG TPA: HesA/MoeB/ThiF family protein [Candidatus Cloacimonadota bacterium]|jgi:molybdopterin/thiamine biosynthesis adenylyltransferase|nr:HesA/MoeB/ThiF family protein [Candidatus Cloacimonadota bacterium]HOD55064.1 HesA/MoeB/ThiF family protein [Candidatus Cloacimonadota bacterium]HPM01746.1 HesA/MoeB/ThiF family protein [Candidatus Cloacimonadota bacterium]